MSTNTTLKQLIDNFISQTEMWAEYLEDGNAKLANKIFDEAKKTEQEIRQYGDSGQKEIWKLMKNNNKGVRYWAATSSLRYRLEDALNVLEELSCEQGAVSASAYLSLKLYYSGEMEIP